jgi:lipoprotein LpqH
MSSRSPDHTQGAEVNNQSPYSTSQDEKEQHMTIDNPCDSAPAVPSAPKSARPSAALTGAIAIGAARGVANPAGVDGPRHKGDAVVKRGIVVGVVGAAIVVTGLVGCSSKQSNPSSSSSASSAAGPQLTIDGQDQKVTGQVSCTANGSNINIGVGDATNGVGAVVGNANPPIVHAVGLGSVNGIVLAFLDAPGQRGNAGAAQNGKSYTIKGTATGVDTSNPQRPQPVTKSFEMDVTCP